MSAPRLITDVAADVLARLIIAREAIEDGDGAYARTLLIDLELDVEAWREAA